MLKRTVNAASLWITALCVLAQGLGGSMGTVLCVGCDNGPGGWIRVGLTASPCTPRRGCCEAEGSRDDRPSTPPRDEDGHGCGCIDVTLPGDGAVCTLPPAPKPPLTRMDAANPVVARLAVVSEPVAGLRRPARAGPPFVPLLAPAARRTVLVI